MTRSDVIKHIGENYPSWGDFTRDVSVKEFKDLTGWEVRCAGFIEEFYVTPPINVIPIYEGDVKFTTNFVSYDSSYEFTVNHSLVSSYEFTGGLY